MKIVWLSLLWITWCIFHSLLIDNSVTTFVKRSTPRFNRYYRLFFNSFSLLTLVPLAIATRGAAGEVVFSWSGGALIVRFLLFAGAVLCFHGGAKRYDFKHFIGLKQVQTGEGNVLMSDTEEFSETGIFGVCRHPWYFGSLLFIWSLLPAYTTPIFIAGAILSMYLVIGTFLEERKLLTLYGESYRRYQKRVSMLFPWKWLRKKIQVQS